jgi:hypothetical protein
VGITLDLTYFECVSRLTDSEFSSSGEENEDELFDVRIHYFSVISVFQIIGY